MRSTPKPKKPKAIRRKKLPKSARVAFLTLLTAVTLHTQTRLLEQTFVRPHAVQEGVFGVSYGNE